MTRRATATLKILLNRNQPVASADGNIFSTGGVTTFWIFADLRYQLSRLGGIYGNYIEEGDCETFEE